MSRIDAIEYIDFDMDKYILSFGDEPFNGGFQYPRDGR